MKDENIQIRISRKLYELILSDLIRPHDYAYERICFVESKLKRTRNGNSIIFLINFHSIPSNQYINDPGVGARINSDAIRDAMNNALETQHGCFHTHYHSLSGDIPEFSDTDLEDNPEIVKSLSRVSKEQAHGMFLMGDRGLNALVKLPGTERLKYADKIVVVGYPMKLSFPGIILSEDTPNRFERQSFLGKNSQNLFENVRVGIVGLGGGGSHVVQQLAHVGILNYVLFDDDITNETNLNRNVGTVLADVENESEKLNIAQRVIKGLLPDAQIIPVDDRWQNSPEDLQICDIVFGCVDSFAGRRDLEIECRRYMIPYIDIGMDVHDKYENENPSMSGQVILSMPDSYCLSCLGYLTEDNLSKEAAKYGDAGGKPQVVWSNGALASTAVGVLVDLLTGWSGQNRPVYLSYDGNSGTITEHIRLKYLKSNCDHFPNDEVGPVEFKPI